MIIYVEINVYPAGIGDCPHMEISLHICLDEVHTCDTSVCASFRSPFVAAPAAEPVVVHAEEA